MDTAAERVFVRMQVTGAVPQGQAIRYTVDDAHV
jgi:hypothetical protein